MLLAPAVAAIEFDQVRNFEDVFVISGTAAGRDRIEISWNIEKGYYLYNNKFLRFVSATEGVVLGTAEIPRGEIKFDELLGEEVEKYHDELTVILPVESLPADVDAVQLKVRSQGCLENELCYPPTQQLLTIDLPRPGTGVQAEPSVSVLSGQAPPDPFFLQDGQAALQPEEAFIYESIGLQPGHCTGSLYCPARLLPLHRQIFISA